MTRHLAERGREEQEKEPLPASHYYSHFRKDNRCKTCRDARLKRYPAYSQDICAIEMLSEVSERVSVAMITVRYPDFEGRTWHLASIDHASKRPKGGATKTKEPEDTWPLFETLYPGSRIQPEDANELPKPEPPPDGFLKRPHFPKQVGMDGDPAWGGIFMKKLKERGGGAEDFGGVAQREQ